MREVWCTNYITIYIYIYIYIYVLLYDDIYMVYYHSTIIASNARRINATSRAPLLYLVSRMEIGIFTYIMCPLMMMSRRRSAVVVYLAVALLVWGFWRLLLVALE